MRNFSVVKRSNGAYVSTPVTLGSVVNNRSSAVPNSPSGPLCTISEECATYWKPAGNLSSITTLLKSDSLLFSTITSYSITSPTWAWSFIAFLIINSSPVLSGIFLMWTVTLSLFSLPVLSTALNTLVISSSNPLFSVPMISNSNRLRWLDLRSTRISRSLSVRSTTSLSITTPLPSNSVPVKRQLVNTGLPLLACNSLIASVSCTFAAFPAPRFSTVRV